MKQILALLFLWISIGSLTAEISVKSFRRLDNDLDARITAPLKDQNGVWCAIIKVVTTQTGFFFDNGMLGIMKTENKPSEIWLYVPFGTKRLTITHAKLGQLRNYILPESVDKATCYELILTTGKVITTVEDDQIATEWVVITSDPPGADVYIDDKSTGFATPYTKQWPIGSHTYRISLDMYHPDAGKFDLLANGTKTRINSILKPAFGQLTLSSTPESGATVALDGMPFVQNTPCTLEKVKSGQHTITVNKPLYHEASASVTIVDNQTTTLPIVLKPAYGSISVNSSPENGAAVTLDDVATGKVTPCTLEKVKSGSHTISLRREWYAPTKKQLTVVDGEKSAQSIAMNPLFADVKINISPDADLYIDNVKVGTGTYASRMNEGVYTFEARKPKHTTDLQKIQITTGETKTITLSPRAQTGTLEIESTPIDAVITLNGVNKGTTPTTLRNLLVGEYNLTLSLPNYASVNKTISITEGKSLQLNETLANGREVTINSIPAGVSLYIDGNVVGKTPYKSSLTVGNHVLKIENEGKKVEKTVSVSQTGGKTKFEMTIFQSFSEVLDGNSFDMIAIKGGNYEMGSENGEDDEKPIHKVEIGDFYICRTEVTQAQWNAIMGNNPSFFKGDYRPVEQVSWNDTQQFIQKLNTLTGKKYRLPTEAEWEYAAGSATKDGNKYSGTDTDSIVGNYAWTKENSLNETHTVRAKTSNNLGLFDMSGNVWEWCNDWYGDYSGTLQINPSGEQTGENKVNRGGSWHGDSIDCRIAFRSYDKPSTTYSYLGFRLAMSSK